MISHLPLRRKKLCPNCQKRRDKEFFAPRARVCEICKEVKTKLKEQPKLPMHKLKKQVEKVFNAYIRARDKKFGCISCLPRPVEHAGHFWSVGANSALRFNEDNVNGQCDNCNRWKSGNLNEYRLALVAKIGLKRVEWLDAHRKDRATWTREELEEMIVKYQALLERVRGGESL